MLAHDTRPRIKWNRWREAQKYEQAFWERLASTIDNGSSSQLDWYAWRAQQLDRRLAHVVDLRRRAGKVLEIGSGPIGIVNFLDWGERYAIDPLEDFYRQNRSLVELRRPGATYLNGTGESLPFDDASFALVIIDNVIDHTYAPDTILREIHRVLAPGGQLYLSVNVHTRWGAILHALLALLRIDKGHPYTFTSRSLRALLARHQFTVVLEEIEDHRQVRRADRTSAALKDRIKGYTGLSEFQHMILCYKRNRRARPPR